MPTFYLAAKYNCLEKHVGPDKSNFKDVTGDFFGEFKMEKDPVFSVGKGRYVISTENASHLPFVRSGTTFKFVSYYVEP